MSTIRFLPAIDDAERAAARRHQLAPPPERSLALARETLEIVRAGHDRAPSGRTVPIAELVRGACRGTMSLPAAAVLPAPSRPGVVEMPVQVANETTTAAARRLLRHPRTAILNFANGLVPGGGFVEGACAQEASLCRASARFETLRRDAMYERHRTRGGPESSDHAILPPDVPCFRGAFREIVSAISDGSPERRILGPFRDTFVE